MCNSEQRGLFLFHACFTLFFLGTSPCIVLTSGLFIHFLCKRHQLILRLASLVFKRGGRQMNRKRSCLILETVSATNFKITRTFWISRIIMTTKTVVMMII